MKNQTKRALISSVLALVLCVSMLVGTTFAWFTDSVTSANNKIATGNLDVELKLWTSATTSINITDSSAPVFGEGSLAQNNNAETLWEPGKTQVAYFSIENAGSLDLKYSVALLVTAVSPEANLADVMEYAIIPDATYGTVDAWDADAAQKIENAPGTNYQAEDVALTSGAEHFFALAIHMDEDAGNAYMNSSITFDIKVIAGQLASESDAFGSDYDALASYPGVGYAKVDTAATFTPVVITNQENVVVGSAEVPAAALKDDAATITVHVDDSAYVGNFTVAAGLETIVYDITVPEVKEGNTEPITLNVRIPRGLDPATVSVYHYDDPIACTYDPNDGSVIFKTTSFSPFTFVFDVDSEYVAPELPEDESGKVLYPTATVTPYTDTQDIEWGRYGQWSPTEGLEANLEAAFTFACPDYDNATAEDKAIIDAYRYWHCDFVVSLNTELGENEIFLGGNYGDFGWIGFHNGDMTLPANEEIYLLGSVTNNPWTYADVESFVGTFICGVGDVDDALKGATFTVKLRLTNPENKAEFYDVNTVTYTFGVGYSIDGTEVGLSNDLDLNDPAAADWLNGLLGGN